MSRAELHGIVANLRAYLEWHAAEEPGLGIPPASDRLRDAFESRAQAREAARLESARGAIGGEPERTERPAKSTPEQSRPSASAAAEASKPETKTETETVAKPAGGDKPWVKYGPRARKTFTQKASAEPNDPGPGDDAPTPDDYDGPPLEEPGHDDEAYRGGPSDAPVTPQYPPHGAGNLAEWDASKWGWHGGTFRAPEEGEEGFSPAEKLALLRLYLGDCSRCGLCEGRTNIVFGDGSASARLLFVGEGPGYNEDQQAKPFVGKAGALLDKMIGAMGFDRSEVYIANVVKCRPPDNRDPAPDEIAACSPFLHKQIAAIEPDVIVTLGRFAAHNLLGVDTPIGRMRGEWQEFKGTPVMPTWHPAYLLRNESEKRNAWSDLQTVMKRLENDA